MNTSIHTGQSDINALLQSCNGAIDEATDRLKRLNLDIHGHPEVAYEEFHAVEAISDFLELEGFHVVKGTYGLQTSFTVEVGSGEPLVVICAEYDALSVIGHACGHNLIATSSIAAFTGAARALKTYSLPGRIRLLGTPAEEGKGGKIKLIEAGAFSEEIAAAIMAHPVASSQLKHGHSGLAGLEMIASYKFKVEFRGRSAHAGGQPWNGLNALDAAVAAYNNISMLRQQIRPDERIHGVIEDGGTVPNIIPEYTRMNWYVRSPTIKRCEILVQRVKNCCDAAAVGTGCQTNYTWASTYKNLRVNEPLCKQYVQDMQSIGEQVMLRDADAFTASTDMGNFHGAFAIPTAADVSPHNPGFTKSAGTDEAHEAALQCAKGLAMLTVRVLVDAQLVEQARKEFNIIDE